jgi:hypothetical protein
MAAVPTKVVVVALAEAAVLLVAVAEALFEVAEAEAAVALAEVAAAAEGNLVNKNIKKALLPW